MIKKKESDAIPIENQLGLILSKEAKSYLASLSMPGDKYIDLELKHTGSIYVAPANGYFSIKKVQGYNSTANGVSMENVTRSLYTIHVGSEYSRDLETGCYMVACKGDQVKVWYGATGATLYFRFIYAKGEVE